MATAPKFVNTPINAQARIAAANTASDGSGTLVTAYTVPAGGAKINRLVFSNSQATAAASSAMVVRAFVTDAAGANPRLRGEAAIGAATRTVAVIGASGTISFPGGLDLLEGQIIKVVQSVYAGVQDQMDVFVEGGAFT